MTSSRDSGHLYFHLHRCGYYSGQIPFSMILAYSITNFRVFKIKETSHKLQCALATRGRVYSTCVRSVILHAAETWAMTAATLNHLRRNDHAMIRWICNVKAKDEVSSDTLISKLGIQDLDMVLRTSRVRWFGYVERSTGWIAKVRKLNVVAQKRPGRPKKTWDEVLVDDRKKLGMDFADPMIRSEWRGRLRGRLVKQAQPSVEENRL